WDLNPRYSFPYTALPMPRLRPLGHLSSQLAGTGISIKYAGYSIPPVILYLLDQAFRSNRPGYPIPPVILLCWADAFDQIAADIQYRQRSPAFSRSPLKN